MIQVALICLLGVLVPGLVWLLNIYCSPRSHSAAPSTILLRKIQKLLLETNGFLAISFQVAAIFAYTKTPSVLEISFISNLMNFQLTIIIGILWAQFADNTINKTYLGWPWTLYYFTLFGALLATTCAMKIQNKIVYENLAKECHKQHQFVDVSSSLNDGAGIAKWLGIGFAIGVGIAFFFPLLILPWKLVRNKIPEWLKKHGVNILFCFILWVYVADIIMSVVPTEQVRKLVKQTSGPQTSEEKWRYGQTTAILLWFPFFWSSIKETISRCSSF